MDQVFRAAVFSIASAHDLDSLPPREYVAVPDYVARILKNAKVVKTYVTAEWDVVYPITPFAVDESEIALTKQNVQWALDVAYRGDSRFIPRRHF